MQKQHRMIWTLCVLAVSMTGAAALLHKFEPYTGSDGAASPAQLQRLARSLVDDDVIVDASRWHAVEVLRGPTDSDGTTLSASADPTESHFYVDSHGRISRSSRWRKQSAAPSAPRSIRVQVSVSDDRPMTAPQWYAVQAVIDALDESVRGTGTSLPVRTHGEFRQVQFFAPSPGDKTAELSGAAG